MKNISVYIHIPFCDHKCIYCDFYSIIRYDDVPDFFKSVERETEHYAAKLRENYRVRTIFFGGGTPSFVDPTFVGSIIEKLSMNFRFAEEVEITLETNPGTVDKTKLLHFKDAGINRFSVGIQSFGNDELKFLTRIHDKQTAIKTVEDIYSTGIENISIDLIFNLPGQTKKKWKASLDQAIRLPVKHISTYSLILERGTILNKMVLDGKVTMQDNDYDAELYEYTMEFMDQQKFIQYEVSNFCRPGYQCIHNLAYWRHDEYLGLGTSAHSFVNNERWWNYSSLKMYIEAINLKGSAQRNSEKLKGHELLEEYVMLNLRGPGMDLNLLRQRYGDSWINRNNSYIDKLLSEGFITDNNNFIKFTKRGYSLCDEILSNFL